MQKSQSFTLRSATLVVTALVVLATLLQPPPVRSETAASGGVQLADRLSGTWQVQVTHVDCNTRTPFGPPYETLYTFVNGGSLIEQGTRVPPPAVSRTVSQGTWKHTGQKNYDARLKFYRFDAAGAYLGGIDLSLAIKLRSTNKTYIFAGVGRAFDAAGNFGPPGCVEGVGERFELAP